MSIHDFRETVHDSDAEFIGFRIIAEAFLRICDAEQVIDCFSETDDTEHAGEVVQGDKAFLHKEIGLEEVRLVYQEVNAVVHVLQHQSCIVRKHAVQEVFGILCFQRALVHAQTR